ncbi:MAG: hypothetical protein WCE45_06855 [Sedimentisphaerales bacterium]
MEQQNSLQKLNEPIFSRKKSLLTVSQYATRQGVSAGVVQECAKLGVVQVRKHKDKTFIVDLPLDTYKIIKQQDSLSPETIDSTLSANKITELVNRIFKAEGETKILPAETKRKEDRKNSRIHSAGIKPAPAESLFSQPQHKEPATIPDLQLFADPPLLLAKQERGQPARFRIPLLRGFTESIKSVSVWKLASVAAAAAFVISLCAYAWVSIDRKIQQQKLQQAYESINKLMSKYEETRQQARLYEFDMMSWRSEAEQSKRALLSTESELQNARKNLSETRKDLDNMQQYNNETLKDLNEQITKIRSRIPIAGE